MATYSTLAADADIMREMEAELFPENEYSDTDLQDLKKTSAKALMKTDLCQELRLTESDTDDMTTLDSIVDKYESKLQKALIYKQYYLYFYEKYDGIDGKNFMKMTTYESLYKGAKNEFSGLTIDSYKTTKTYTLRRS